MQVCATIRGRVQGVCFRASVCDIARKLALTGWVGNEADGSVSLVAVGDRRVLEILLKELGSVSPPARVDSIEVDWQEVENDYYEFEIRY